MLTGWKYWWNRYIGWFPIQPFERKDEKMSKPRPILGFWRKGKRVTKKEALEMHRLEMLERARKDGRRSTINR